MSTTPPPPIPPSSAVVPEVTPVALVAAEKPLSPYALLSTDSPGTLITHTQFRGPNYEEWAKAVRVAMRAKKKYGFLDGTIVQPTNPGDLEDWWTVNSMIISWIFNTIENNLRSTISYRETAKELWDDIRQRFSVGHGPRIHNLKKEIANCKQNGDSVMNYFARFKKFWDDLRDAERLPTCTCGGCTCNLVSRLETLKEDERVHQLLMGLDDAQFNALRSTIIATEPLPNVNKVYSQLVQQEEVHQATQVASSSTSNQVMSFAVKSGAPSSSTSGGARKEDLVCTHCKRTGHSVDTCFSLHGFPDWVLERGRGGGRFGRGGRTGGRGRGFFSARANVAQGILPTPSHASDSGAVMSPTQAAFSGLSPADWSTLQDLWKAHKSSPEARLSGPCDQEADWSG